MSRIIGCRDLHIAPLVSDTVGAPKPTYGKPVRIPSVVNVSITDSVEQSKFFSDDTVEQAFTKTASKEVTIELGHLSNELESIITGKEVDESGVLIQKSSDAPTEVALMFRAPKSKGGAFRYICLYKGTLSRTESEYATQEDSIESSNINLTGTFTALLCNDQMAAVADSDDDNTSAVVSKWFTQVYGAEVAGGVAAAVKEK